MKVTDVEIMRAIDTFIRDNGYSPTYRDVSEAIGIAVGSTKHRLERMRRDGFVTFEDGKARTIRVAISDYEE